MLFFNPNLDPKEIFINAIIMMIKNYENTIKQWNKMFSSEIGVKTDGKVIINKDKKMIIQIVKLEIDDENIWKRILTSLER